MAPHIRNVEIYDLVYRRNVADKADEEMRRYRFKEETYVSKSFGPICSNTETSIRSLYCNSNQIMKVVVVVVVVHFCSSVIGEQEDIIKKRQTYTSRLFGGLGAARDTHTKELNV